MKNKNKVISASEINKYTYCPYQWYYERLYGKEAIMSQYRDRNEKMRLYDSLQSNFAKGNSFHNKYLFKNKFKNIIKMLCLIILIIFAIIILLLIKNNF